MGLSCSDDALNAALNNSSTYKNDILDKFNKLFDAACGTEPDAFKTALSNITKYVNDMCYDLMQQNDEEFFKTSLEGYYEHEFTEFAEEDYEAGSGLGALRTLLNALKETQNAFNSGKISECTSLEELAEVTPTAPAAISRLSAGNRLSSSGAGGNIEFPLIDKKAEAYALANSGSQISNSIAKIISEFQFEYGTTLNNQTLDKIKSLNVLGKFSMEQNSAFNGISVDSTLSGAQFLLGYLPTLASYKDTKIENTKYTLTISKGNETYKLTIRPDGQPKRVVYTNNGVEKSLNITYSSDGNVSGIKYESTVTENGVKTVENSDIDVNFELTDDRGIAYIIKNIDYSKSECPADTSDNKMQTDEFNNGVWENIEYSINQNMQVTKYSRSYTMCSNGQKNTHTAVLNGNTLDETYSYDAQKDKEGGYASIDMEHIDGKQTLTWSVDTSLYVLDNSVSHSGDFSKILQSSTTDITKVSLTDKPVTTEVHNSVYLASGGLYKFTSNSKCSEESQETTYTISEPQDTDYHSAYNFARSTNFINQLTGPGTLTTTTTYFSGSPNLNEVEYKAQGGIRTETKIDETKYRVDVTAQTNYERKLESLTVTSTLTLSDLQNTWGGGRTCKSKYSSSEDKSWGNWETVDEFPANSYIYTIENTDEPDEDHHYDEVPGETGAGGAEKSKIEPDDKEKRIFLGKLQPLSQTTATQTDISSLCNKTLTSTEKSAMKIAMEYLKNSYAVLNDNKNQALNIGVIKSGIEAIMDVFAEGRTEIEKMDKAMQENFSVLTKCYNKGDIEGFARAYQRLAGVPFNVSLIVSGPNAIAENAELEKAIKAEEAMCKALKTTTCGTGQPIVNDQGVVVDMTPPAYIHDYAASMLTNLLYEATTEAEFTSAYSKIKEAWKELERNVPGFKFNENDIIEQYQEKYGSNVSTTSEKAYALTLILYDMSSNEEIQKMQNLIKQQKETIKTNENAIKAVTCGGNYKDLVARVAERLDIAYTALKITGGAAIAIGAGVLTGGSGALPMIAGILATTAGNSMISAIELATDNNGLSWDEAGQIGLEAVYSLPFAALGVGTGAAAGAIGKGISRAAGKIAALGASLTNKVSSTLGYRANIISKAVNSKIAAQAVSNALDLGFDAVTGIGAARLMGGDSTVAQEAGWSAFGMLVASAIKNPASKAAQLLKTKGGVKKAIKKIAAFADNSAYQIRQIKDDGAVDAILNAPDDQIKAIKEINKIAKEKGWSDFSDTEKVYLLKQYAQDITIIKDVLEISNSKPALLDSAPVQTYKDMQYYVSAFKKTIEAWKETLGDAYKTIKDKTKEEFIRLLKDETGAWETGENGLFAKIKKLFKAKTEEISVKSEEIAKENARNRYYNAIDDYNEMIKDPNPSSSCIKELVKTKYSILRGEYDYHSQKSVTGLIADTLKVEKDLMGMGFCVPQWAGDKLVFIHNLGDPQLGNGFKGKEAKIHVSLQVIPNRAMLSKINKFLNTGNVITFDPISGERIVVNVCDYVKEWKVPGTMEGWFNREDPITIYFDKDTPPRILEEIAQIIQPYVSETETKSLVGQEWARGMSVEKETSGSANFKTNQKALLDYAMTVNNEQVRKALGNYILGRTNMSSGTYNAIKKVIEDYKEIYNKDITSDIRPYEDDPDSFDNGPNCVELSDVEVQRAYAENHYNMIREKLIEIGYDIEKYESMYPNFRENAIKWCGTIEMGGHGTCYSVYESWIVARDALDDTSRKFAYKPITSWLRGCAK